jgi:hypothetical protein
MAVQVTVQVSASIGLVSLHDGVASLQAGIDAAPGRAKAPPNNCRIVYVELPGLAHWDSGAAR